MVEYPVEDGGGTRERTYPAPANRGTRIEEGDRFRTDSTRGRRDGPERRIELEHKRCRNGYAISTVGEKARENNWLRFRAIYVVQAGTSGKFGVRAFDSSARWIQVDIGQPSHGQGLQEATVLFRQPPVVLDAEQYMCGFASVRDEHGLRLPRPFRASDILVEFAAGNGRDSYEKAPRNGCSYVITISNEMQRGEARPHSSATISDRLRTGDRLRRNAQRVINGFERVIRLKNLGIALIGYEREKAVKVARVSDDLSAATELMIRRVNSHLTTFLRNSLRHRLL